MLNLILLMIFSYGNKVDFWNIIILFGLGDKIFLLFKKIFFLDGFLSLVIIFKSVDFLYLEGLRIYINFFFCIFKFIFFNIVIFLFFDKNFLFIFLIVNVNF